MDFNEQLREEISAGLERTGIDATSLSKQIGRSKDFIRDFLQGRKRSLAQDAAEQIRAILDKSRGTLLTEGYRPPPQLLGERDLKVFASVEGGPGEMVVFSTDAYEVIPRPWFAERDRESFGIYIVGESMEPVYEAGQIVIVSPLAPLVKGKDFVLAAEPVGGDFRATLKRYRGQKEKAWLAKQFNPEKDVEFDRNVWRKAYRVLGRFDG